MANTPEKTQVSLNPGVTVDPATRRAAPADNAVNTNAHPHAEEQAQVGRFIGPYALKRLIASGGMGVVYEAVQEHPRRSVALKVMRRGMMSRSAMRRFEFEAQILGRLRHPCIAQVYEAGMHHEEGREATPYFVMEYIPAARTLTEYARLHQLDTRHRLELFARVCDGVHHGHQKGVIHRDLKPGNVLVDSSGQPKVIDFGVARATDSDLAVTTLQTDVGQLIGTLQYMSPEQIEADPNDLDVRSDVYALGVVLYELLTGRLPYDVSNAAVVHATRIIREQSPQRLSTIDTTLRGDVETITLKALQKDREARYQSALDLAQDIRRYLKNEPISARPPSLAYQIRVFARRNKAAFAAIVAIIAVSMMAAVVSAAFARRAIIAQKDTQAALEQARQEAEANKAAGDFMRDVLALASPQRSLGRQITVREALDIAAANITKSTADQPLAEAAARLAVGATYRALGLYSQAHEHLSRALELRRAHRGPEHAETLVVVAELAGTLGDMSRIAEAIDLLERNLITQRRVLGRLHADTLRSANSLAWLHFLNRNAEESEQQFRQLYDDYVQALGPDSPHAIKTKTNIAMALATQRRGDEAEPIAREAADASIRTLGPKNPDSIYARHTHAWSLYVSERYAEAEPLWRSVVADATEVMGADHPYRLFWLDSLGDCLAAQEKFEDAEQIYLDAVVRRERVLEPDHPDIFDSRLGLVQARTGLGRFAEAEQQGLQWRAAAINEFGVHAPIVRDFDHALHEMYIAWNRPDEAAKYQPISAAD